MIKQFSTNTLSEFSRELIKLNINKENVIQLVYTGDERMNWVCFYWVENK